MKHIDSRILWLQDLIAAGGVRLKKRPRTQNLADMLKKPFKKPFQKTLFKNPDKFVFDPHLLLAPANTVVKPAEHDCLLLEA